MSSWKFLQELTVQNVGLMFSDISKINPKSRWEIVKGLRSRFLGFELKWFKYAYLLESQILKCNNVIRYILAGVEVALMFWSPHL